MNIMIIIQICEMSCKLPEIYSIKETKEIPSVNFSNLGELSCFRATSFMLSTSLLGLKLGLFELCRGILIITRYHSLYYDKMLFIYYLITESPSYLYWKLSLSLSVLRGVQTLK